MLIGAGFLGKLARYVYNACADSFRCKLSSALSRKNLIINRVKPLMRGSPSISILIGFDVITCPVYQAGNKRGIFVSELKGHHS